MAAVSCQINHDRLKKHSIVCAFGSQSTERHCIFCEWLECIQYKQFWMLLTDAITPSLVNMMRT